MRAIIPFSLARSETCVHVELRKLTKRADFRKSGKGCMPLHSERSNCCRTPYFFRLVKSPIHFFRSLLTKSANFCIFETYLFGDIVSNLFFYSLTHLLFQLSMRKSISKYPIIYQEKIIVIFRSKSR